MPNSATASLHFAAPPPLPHQHRSKRVELPGDEEDKRTAPCSRTLLSHPALAPCSRTLPLLLVLAASAVSAVLVFFQASFIVSATLVSRKPSCLLSRQLCRASEQLLTLVRINVYKRCGKYKLADGHTVSNAPDLFRPPKLSGTGPG